MLNRIFRVCVIGGTIIALSAAGCGQTKTERLLLNAQEIRDSFTDQELPPTVKRILASPDQFELMTIGSRLDRSLGMPRIEGYPILGTMFLTKAAQQQLIHSLDDAVQHNDHAFALCFQPGYAITATRGTSHVIILVCFHCKQIEIDQDGQPTALVISDSPEELFAHLAASMKPPMQQPI